MHDQGGCAADQPAPAAISGVRWRRKPQPHLSSQQAEAEQRLQRHGRYRQIPDVVDLETRLACHPERRHGKGHDARNAADQGGQGVAEGLEQTGAGEDQSLRDEVPGDDAR